MRNAAPSPTIQACEAFCWAILPEVSRTFAIGIKALPQSSRRAVMVAYLVCRIADTIEDDPHASVGAKVDGLARLADAIKDPTLLDRFMAVAPTFVGEASHLRLLNATPTVFTVLAMLAPAERAVVDHRVLEMIEGMCAFVERHPRGIRLATYDEFSEYCYYVAGTVGHLLTGLWTLHGRGGPQLAARLASLAEAFGRGLQTVNILRDVAVDARCENSIYLPEDLLRRCGSGHERVLDPRFAGATGDAIAQLSSLARADLEAALAFTQALPRRWPRLRFFCALPLMLALASLAAVERATYDPAASKGPKVDRRAVRRIVRLTALAIFSNRALRLLAARLAAAPGPVPISVATGGPVTPLEPTLELVAP